MKPLFAVRWRLRKALAVCLLLTLAMFLLSACNGNPQTQQQANQDRQTLDHALAHAQSIGVSANLLQPIREQEGQLINTHAPLGLFDDQIVDNYYQNLSVRYSRLSSQVTGLETQITQQLEFQADQDLQSLSNALAERQGQQVGNVQTFSQQMAIYQQEMTKAQYPKDYQQIITGATNATQALHLMGPAYNDLSSFQKVIQQLQSSSLDVTVFQQEEKNNLQSFRTASAPGDFSRLIDLINTELNETTTVSTQAIPYVGQVKINQFKADIQLIKQFNGTDVSKYQQLLQTDQQALNNAKSVGNFLLVSAQIDSDIASIQFPLTQAQSSYLLQQFHSEVTAWGQTHQYADKYDGQSYPLDYPYAEQGIGADADAAVQFAQTPDDYLSAIDLIKNDILHLHMMESDYSDKIPYNQPHPEDLTLMQHYGISTAGEVLVVSLVEQVLRYYQNGKLVRSFYITSGQYDLPSPPGYWQIFLRQSPTVFKSSEPKGSAFWYPNTNINFAMEYHSNGYFFHDSWWRVDYGAGTEFPHYDSGGDESFAGSGSHGCINMAENDIAWLYPNSTYGAQVILY